MSSIFDWNSPNSQHSGKGPASADRMKQIRRRRVGAAVLTVVVIVVMFTVVGKDDSSSEKAKQLKEVQLVSFGKNFESALHDNFAGEIAVNRVLTYTPFVAFGSPNKKEVALTFDDGPSTFTPKVIDVLKKEKVTATFFVVGVNIKSYKQMVEQEVSGGFITANHTESHPMMGELSYKDQLDQVLTGTAVMKDAGAPTPRLYRPPYRSFNDQTFKILKKMGMLMILWSVDSEDYSRPGVDALVQNVVADTRPGSIILMHDGGGDRSQTVAALPEIIKKLKKQGYQLVSVPQLLQNNPPRNQDIPSGSNN